MRVEVYGLALGFGLGSIPFAWLLHRAVTGRDLRREGSGNPGAANVNRSAGPAWGAAAVVLDAGKGSLAAWGALHLLGDAAVVPAAVGAVLGHVYTPWLAGRGGKGVATAAGGFGVLAPGAVAAAAAVFAVTLAATRYVSLASVAGAVALPAAMLWLGPKRAVPAAAAVLLLIAWRHRENFARMRAGAEPRV